jgi:hypothetical protein
MSVLRLALIAAALAAAGCGAYGPPTRPGAPGTVAPAADPNQPASGGPPPAERAP